jgi:hypothetical protein
MNKNMTGLYASDGTNIVATIASLAKISVSPDNPYLTTDAHGVLYNKEMTQLLYCPPKAGITGEYKIPDTVTSIGDWAFAGCSALETIVIPASVTSIGKGAFSECTSLKSIIFEDGSKLTSIGDYAFNDCSALTSITLPEGLESIGIFSFNGCTSLASFKTPSTLKSIGDLAFYNCDALNADGALVLNEAIEKIGKFAFAGIRKEYIVAPEGSFAAEYVDKMIDPEAEEETTVADETTAEAAE